jgi:hypothetical protein
VLSDHEFEQEQLAALVFSSDGNDWPLAFEMESSGGGALPLPSEPQRIRMPWARLHCADGDTTARISIPNIVTRHNLEGRVHDHAKTDRSEQEKRSSLHWSADLDREGEGDNH